MRFNTSILSLAPLLSPQHIFQLDTQQQQPAYGAMPARLNTFHEGEREMRSLLKVPAGMNPTAAGLPMSYAMRVVESPLVAVGTLDAQGRPWTSVWGGERGFAQPVADGVLGLNSHVDLAHDPVYAALWGSHGDEVSGGDGVVQPNKMMSALAIDLATRDRVKLMGTMVAGAADRDKSAVQMALLVTESLGNCPKYLNKKRVVASELAPEVVVNGDGKDGSQGEELPGEAVELLDRADMFFMSSTHGETMDTNHRGGAPGFVRVLRNDAGGVVLVYPEYSGNRLYQSLGNLKRNPHVGIVIPDFTSGNVLYLTGTSRILIGAEASAVLSHTNLAVEIAVSASRFVKAGLPFKGVPLEYSPYNPPVRHLLSERDAHTEPRADNLLATLTDKEILTPSINRYTFTLAREGSSGAKEEKPSWQPGQHVTLDFEPELGLGYSHMREDDPQSLNDDLVRTFTISSEPDVEGVKLQITARKNGPATRFLERHNLRVPLQIPVMGFGGEPSFQLPTTTANGALKPVYIAGGVGITPLLAQANAVLAAGVPLMLLWSLNRHDVNLALDAFERIEGLAGATTLYVTGGGELEEESEAAVKLRALGVRVKTSRIGAESLKEWKGKGSKFYLCAGPALLRGLQGWLDGENMVWEDFGY